jgi:hypothetical protein
LIRWTSYNVIIFHLSHQLSFSFYQNSIHQKQQRRENPSNNSSGDQHSLEISVETIFLSAQEWKYQIEKFNINSFLFLINKTPCVPSSAQSKQKSTRQSMIEKHKKKGVENAFLLSVCALRSTKRGMRNIFPTSKALPWKQKPVGDDGDWRKGKEKFNDSISSLKYFSPHTSRDKFILNGSNLKLNIFISSPKAIITALRSHANDFKIIDFPSFCFNFISHSNAANFHHLPSPFSSSMENGKTQGVKSKEGWRMEKERVCACNMKRRYRKSINHFPSTSFRRRRCRGWKAAKNHHRMKSSILRSSRASLLIFHRCFVAFLDMEKHKERQKQIWLFFT